MADPTGAEIQRNMAWMRGNLEKTPKGMNPDIANMVRDVRNMYFPGETRPVGATPAMQSAVQGQPLPAAGEPVRPAPAMRTLAQGVAPQGQPRGYSGMAWSAPTATEMPGLGPQSATPDLTNIYNSPVGPKRPAPTMSDMIQKMGAPQQPKGFWDAATMGGMNPQTATPAEDAGTLRKIAGAAGALGGIMQGASLPGMALRAGIAYPVVNVLGQAGSELLAAREGRTTPLRAAGAEAREQYRKDIASGEYGHALGSALRATAQTGGQVLGNMVTPFGNVIRGAVGAPTSTAAAAPETAPTLGDAMNPQPTLGAPSMARITRGGTPTAEPGGQITVHRGTNAPESYNVGIRDASGERPVIGRTGYMERTPDQVAAGAGLTPAEQAYNTNLARGMALENQRQALINDALEKQLTRGALVWRPGSSTGGWAYGPPSARMINALMGGKASVSGAPAVPPRLQPKVPTESDLLTGQGRQAIGQIGQLDDDFATRTRQLQQQHPNWTPEQIAADPEVRRNRLRKQQIQDQFKNIIELSGKKLPTLDQVLAGQYRGE